MGKLYIFCRDPHYAFPPGSLKYQEVTTHDKLDGLTMPRSREECVNGIYVAEKWGETGTQLPWKPYNFTNPIINWQPSEGEYVTDYTLQWIARKSPLMPYPREYLVDCIDSATVSYSGINQGGTFKAKLHPDAHYPAPGDYITAFWVEDETAIAGNLVFYGRVVEAENDDASDTITAEDAVAVLMDNDQLIVHNLPAETAIYRLVLGAGAYMYRQTAYPDEREREPQLIIQNKQYQTPLDGIKDILENWYLVTGYRQYIYDDGGIIALCSYDMPTDYDIIDKSMVEKWSFKPSTAKTYTRVTMSYSVINKKDNSITTIQNYHLGTSWNVAFRHRRFHTYQGSAGSLQEANLMAEHVLKYHGYPTFQLTLRGAAGILRLRPGMLFGVPYVLDNGGVQYLAVCIVRDITHTFRNGSYTMDITADLDPYDWDVMPFPLDTSSLTKRAGWAKRFTLVKGDYSRRMEVRMPKWLRNSMSAVQNAIRSLPMSSEYWRAVNDMQNVVSVVWDTPEFHFWQIPPDVTGRVGEYNGLPVIIPNFGGVHNLDVGLSDLSPEMYDAEMYDTNGNRIFRPTAAGHNTKPKPRNTTYFNSSDYGVAVLIRHSDRYDCYMVSNASRTILPSATAGIFARKFTDSGYFWGSYVRSTFVTPSGSITVPTSYSWVRPRPDFQVTYRLDKNMNIWRIGSYMDVDPTDNIVTMYANVGNARVGQMDGIYPPIGGLGDRLLQANTKVVILDRNTGLANSRMIVPFDAREFGG